jgi:two-component system, NarL family, sensor kinase
LGHKLSTKFNVKYFIFNSIPLFTQESEITVIIVASTIILLLLATFIVLFLFIHQRRAYRYKRQVQKMQEEFSKAQIELQEQVLGTVSAEIHDNLGQMLSVIKLNLSKLSKMVGVEAKKEEELIGEIKTQVSGVITDMRNILKTLSPDFISDFGLSEAVKIELERIDRTGHIKTNLSIGGEPIKFNPKVEIVLFRIAQELMNNAIKHAEATLLQVDLQYSGGLLKMTVSDDGKGFDPDSLLLRDAGQSGNGLKNMKNRVKVIGGNLNFVSSKQYGTRIIIEISIQSSLIIDDHKE